MLGLFAFFYGCLHFTTYLWLDKFFDLGRNAKDVVEAPVHHRRVSPPSCCWCRWRSPRPPGWIRRLGGRRWQMLHRLIYVSAIAGRGALLLAGEVGYPVAGDVWGDHRCPFGVPAGGELDEGPEAAATGGGCAGERAYALLRGDRSLTVAARKPAEKSV